MKLLFIAIVSLFFSGCAQSYIKASTVHKDIVNGGVEQLKKFNDISFVRDAEGDSIKDIWVSNATESAVRNQNIEAIRYLISIDAIHPVSVGYVDENRNNETTPVNVPAAELACGLGDFEVMALLQEYDPSQTVNYTNCLHYILNSQQKFYFTKASPEELNTRIEKVLALGGDINKAPEYGRFMQIDLFHQEAEQPLDSNAFIHRLELLEKSGFYPDAKFPYLFRKETLLLHLSFYEDEDFTSEMAKRLVQLGANVNKIVNRSIPIVLNNRDNVIGKFQERDITALHLARYYNRNKLAETLIALGADESIEDNNGFTSEAYAGAYAKLQESMSQSNRAAKSAGQEYERSILGTASSIFSIGGAVLGY